MEKEEGMVVHREERRGCFATLLRLKVQIALGSSQAVSTSRDDCQIVRIRDDLAPLWKVYVQV